MLAVLAVAEPKTRPGEEWHCRCGGLLATIRGRTVTLPGGVELWGVVRLIVPCPGCGRRSARWLVARRR